MAVLSVFFVRAFITDIDKSHIDQKLTGIVQLLLNNYNYIQNNIGSLNNSNGCSFNDACDPLDESFALNEDNMNYGSQSVQLNDTTVKFINGKNNLSQGIINEICFINGQKTIWETNKDISANNSNLTGIMWQYYGSNSGTSIFYPRFQWPNDCYNSNTSIESYIETTNYDPRTRPWYVSATSAQKNIILLIDLSDSFPDPSGIRLRRMKVSAKLLLGSLSYRDFVGIITFTDYANQYNPQMMRMTIDRIQTIIKYIDSLSIIPGSKANIGKGLSTGFNILSNSIKNGMTSKCNNVFIVLSSGSNDINTMKSIDIVKQYSELKVIIFSNIYRSDSNQGAILDLAETSCNTDGNLLTVDSDQGASYVIQRFNDYMSTATYNTFIRWSEPYYDAITGIKMITASLPIYQNDQILRKPIGVIAIDIALDTIRPEVILSQPSETEFTNSSKQEQEQDQDQDQDILNYLIMLQSCPSLQITTEFLKQIQSPETCKQNISKDQSDGSVKNINWMIAGSIIITIFLVFLPYTILINKKEQDNYGNRISDKVDFFSCAYTLSFLSFIFGLWALCVLWIHLFPEIIKYEDWIETVCIVERLDSNPSKCCEITNCDKCQESNGPSCDSLVNSGQEGSCANGYYCCSEYSYSCNCVTSCSSSKDSASCSTICSTCFECAQSVNNNNCDVICGTCYDPVLTSRYKDQNGVMSYGYTSIHCGLNDLTCLNQFINSNSPIGKSETCYFNPYNKNEITMSIKYSPGILAAFLIPSISMGIIFIIVSITLLVKCFE